VHFLLKAPQVCVLIMAQQKQLSRLLLFSLLQVNMGLSQFKPLPFKCRMLQGAASADTIEPASPHDGFEFCSCANIDLYSCYVLFVVWLSFQSLCFVISNQTRAPKQKGDKYEVVMPVGMPDEAGDAIVVPKIIGSSWCLRWLNSAASKVFPVTPAV
jgi:hypothetical protein